ncbi:hypothetical protein BACOVA_01560 [Bacteroides ovatus ATCC 8483]|uniref:Uncharacterized protein n=1 Tax=Bacteroides ovatus (strain ATCC 8483 / DSM 1896 / JCM 5824 / BCRC 10623 / CCUG 4943 / NCTC 11153) TaxID=411476 RepID=A0AAN3AA75_BACO1|nr:hypothetical protein BACOVA_01560 [Bacteroides ovatus ATCC 8483]
MFYYLYFLNWGNFFIFALFPTACWKIPFFPSYILQT